jgi:hypothetical protein
VNLRGVREAGLAFMLPTYVFAGSVGILKWFEYEGRTKELGTLKVLVGATEHQRTFLILIREVQR